MTNTTPTPVLVELAGNAFDRGLAQARRVPASVEPVRQAVALRLQAARDSLATPSVRDYLDAQWDFHCRQAADELAEMSGVAAGYGIDERSLFTYLHLGVIGDLADGCTAWARTNRERGALLAKNRDFRGEHLGLQRVFRHVDPAWGGRRVLAVGSLGSPGVYSSGINSDALALADTAVGTSDHGAGLLRYFLMTRILAQASTVDEALAVVRATAHTGGGSLVLADAGGNMASVELGHRAIAVEACRRDYVARTNHFTGAETAAAWRASPADPMAASSARRLAVVEQALRADAGPEAIDDALALMSCHDGEGNTGLCRHGQDGDAQTISCAVFALVPPTLYFCAGAPCSGARTQLTP